MSDPDDRVDATLGWAQDYQDQEDERGLEGELADLADEEE